MECRAGTMGLLSGLPSIFKARHWYNRPWLRVWSFDSNSMCTCRGIGNVLDLHDYARQGPDVLNSTPAVAAPGGIDVGTGNILIAVVGRFCP